MPECCLVRDMSMGITQLLADGGLTHHSQPCNIKDASRGQYNCSPHMVWPWSSSVLAVPAPKTTTDWNPMRPHSSSWGTQSGRWPHAQRNAAASHGDRTHVSQSSPRGLPACFLICVRAGPSTSSLLGPGGSPARHQSGGWRNTGSRTRPSPVQGAGSFDLAA